MEYMTTKEAVLKWNISERRIRRLLQDERIEGAIKVGNTWNIPIDANKPFDRRESVIDEFIINLDNDYFKEVDDLYNKLNSKRPLKENTVKSLRDEINLEWTYNSNGIEGNTLTLKETKVVLEGITIGGKTIREHLEALNHEDAIEYLETLLDYKSDISEWHIKKLHYLIMKGIDNDNAGKYRNSNVTISGAKHIPPDYIKVPELMEKLIISYKSWKDFHPLIRAALIHGELVKIHPFIDGNGRTARVIMNMELMKNGYVPVIIKKENRIKYYEALDKAHIKGDYTDFVKLITKSEKEMLNRYLKLIN